MDHAGDRRGLRGLPLAGVAFFGLTLAAALTAVLWKAMSQEITTSDLWQAALLAAAALLHAEATRNVERIRWRRDAVHVDLNSTWIVAACLVLPVPLTAALVVVVYAHVWLRVRRTPLFRRIFNIAMFAVASATATVVFDFTGGGTVVERLSTPTGAAVVLVAAMCFTLTNVAILPTWLTLGRLTKRPFRTVLGTIFGSALEAATLCLGVLVAFVMDHNPLLVAVALPLVLILHRNELIHQVEQTAKVDGKTGLLNATAWSDCAMAELAKAQRRNQSAGVLVLDLDLFKKVNDTFGHLAGDEVLRQVARTMRAEIRANDSAGRFGGEEFVVLLPDTSIAQMVRIGERIRQRVEKLTVTAQNGTGQETITGLSVSIGAASFPAHGQDLDQLVAAADTALYEAKSNGRNQIRLAPFNPT